MRWATGTDWNTTARSQYGRRDYQITSVPMPSRGAQIFNKIVDTEAIKKVADEIAEIKQSQRLQEKPNSERKRRAQEAKEVHDGLRRELVSCRLALPADTDDQSDMSQDIARLANELKKFHKAQADLGMFCEWISIESIS